MNIDGDVVFVDKGEQFVAVGDKLVACDDVVHERGAAEFDVFRCEVTGVFERARARARAKKGKIYVPDHNMKRKEKERKQRE